MQLEIRITGTKEQIKVFTDFLETLPNDENDIAVDIRKKDYASRDNNLEIRKYLGLSFSEDSFK